MNNDMRVALVSLLSAIIGGGIVATANYVVGEHQIAVKMIEIAVGLLKEDPKGPLQPARQWAVKVIVDNSTTPLSAAAQLALSNCSVIIRLPVTIGLDVNDTFGQIAEKAMEKAQGLRGECLQ